MPDRRIPGPPQGYGRPRILPPSEHPVSTMTALPDGAVRWDCNCGRAHDDGCYTPGTRTTCPFFAFNLHEDTLQTTTNKETHHAG